MSLSAWILLGTAVFELGIAAFLFAGFRAFERDPETKRIRLLREDLETAKARKYVRVQSRGI